MSLMEFSPSQYPIVKRLEKAIACHGFTIVHGAAALCGEKHVDVHAAARSLHEHVVIYVSMA
jgi:hypothetical protein